jgi:HK97 family phage prohead protease
MALLAGQLSEPSTDSIRWPLLHDDEASDDERILYELVTELGYERADWGKLVSEAAALNARADVHRMERTLAAALERHPALEGDLLKAILKITKEKSMEHKQLTATTTATDQELGTFTALASGWEADREGDTIKRGAFDATIAAWQASGKQLPLLLEHTSEVVGSVDPWSMRASDAGLVVAGEVDRSTPEGQRLWRSIKSNTAGFSIGFMAKSRPRNSGRELTEIDLLEISWTPRPMNAATRALSWKSADNTARLREEFDAVLTETKSTAPIQVASFDC